MATADDLKTLIDMVLAGGAAAVAAADPAAGIPAAAAATAMSAKFRSAFGEHTEQMAHAAREGIRGTGQGVDAALETLLASDEGVALVAEVLQGIAASAFKEKARALGSCVGHAASSSSEAAIESEALWVRLINQLQRPHAVALLALDEPALGPPDPLEPGATDTRKAEREFTRTDEFVNALKPYDEFTATSVRADLQSWGLARTVYGDQIGLHGGALDSDTFWQRTKLGGQVVERLRAADETADRTTRSG